MFNVTKLSSEIKKSHTLYWYRANEIDYVTNGYWAIKTNLSKEEHRKILSTLVLKFGLIPEDGKEYKFGSLNKKDSVIEISGQSNWMNVFLRTDLAKIENTHLTSVEGKYNCRIFKGQDYIYVQIKYIEMINEDSKILFEGTSKVHPICASKEDDIIMLTTVRVFNDNEYLKKIC